MEFINVLVSLVQNNSIWFVLLPCLSLSLALSTSFTCPLSLGVFLNLLKSTPPKKTTKKKPNEILRNYEATKKHEIKSVAAASHKNATSFETFPVPSTPVSFRIDGHSKDDSSNRWNIFSRFEFFFFLFVRSFILPFNKRTDIMIAWNFSANTHSINRTNTPTLAHCTQQKKKKKANFYRIVNVNKSNIRNSWEVCSSTHAQRKNVEANKMAA